MTETSNQKVQMQKIGIIGGGQVGQSHIESIRKIRSFEFSGIFDFDQNEAVRLHEKYQVPTFSSIEDLIDHSDIIDITSSGIPHFEMASLALRKSRHVFIDRPLVGSLSEANKLIDLAFEANVKVQIGHMERFKPAFISASKHINQANYIEAHRLLPFSASNSNKHVVLDMMIQDIDIILSIVDSGIKRIQARGHSLDSKELLMVNAHIVFDNGCIANLTSSKMAAKASASMQIYQEHESLMIDLLNNQVQHFDKNSVPNQLNTYSAGNDESTDYIQMELESFISSIKNNTTPFVSLMDGSNALEVAFSILDKVEYWQDVRVKETKFGRA